MKHAYIYKQIYFLGGTWTDKAGYAKKLSKSVKTKATSSLHNGFFSVCVAKHSEQADVIDMGPHPFTEYRVNLGRCLFCEVSGV